MMIANGNKAPCPVNLAAAADGSYFSPELRMVKGYQIGIEGKERFVEDFDEALDQLTKMSPPTWRRPSATSGRFGRVVGTKWIRLTREELFQQSNLLKGEDDA